MTTQNFIVNAIIVSFGLFLILGISGDSTKSQSILCQYLVYDCGNILPGDLVFRKGTGFFSRYFMRTGSKAVPYSHIGIVTGQSGYLKVIHAEASELTGIGFVKTEPLDQFLSTHNALDAAIYRVAATAEKRNKAVNYCASASIRKVPFDTSFELADDSRLYCTELIWRAYKAAGINLVPSYDHIIIGTKSKSIISLNNIIESSLIYATQSITRRQQQ